MDTDVIVKWGVAFVVAKAANDHFRAVYGIDAFGTIRRFWRKVVDDLRGAARGVEERLATALGTRIEEIRKKTRRPCAKSRVSRSLKLTVHYLNLAIDTKVVRDVPFLYHCIYVRFYLDICCSL